MMRNDDDTVDVRHSESIQTASLFSHLIMLQPYAEITQYTTMTGLKLNLRNIYIISWLRSAIPQP